MIWRLLNAQAYYAWPLDLLEAWQIRAETNAITGRLCLVVAVHRPTIATGHDLLGTR